MRKSLLNDFDIIKLRGEKEVILWFELHHKQTEERLRFCACYLLQNNSSRAVSAEDLFQTLMYDIYEFQSDSLITIFGD